jgi:hypothetical protein
LPRGLEDLTWMVSSLCRHNTRKCISVDHVAGSEKRYRQAAAGSGNGKR